MATLLVVMIISVLFDAPLRDVANPQVTPNPEKAPWYFAALQELLAIFHPLVAGMLVPGAIVIGLIALPHIDRSRFVKPRHRKVAVDGLIYIDTGTVEEGPAPGPESIDEPVRGPSCAEEA